MRIICDSISDIPKEIQEKYDITIVPLTIIIDDKEYIDRVDISNEEFYKILRTSDSIPKTSQVTYAKFKETFESFTKKGEDILYIGGSSKASGTFQSAYMASQDVEGEGKVYLFDTYTLSLCAGLFVIKACELKEQGLSAKEIADKLEELKGTETIAFFVDDLKYLQKGGRISSAKASIGTLLKVKPILTIEDGLVKQHSQVRGLKQVYNSILEVTLEKGKDLKDRTIIVGYCDNIEGLEGLKTALRQHIDINSANIHFLNIGAVITAHSGPSVIGITTM